MFSVFKLVTAAAVLALFGSLLMVGVITPEDGSLVPGAATEEPGAFPTGTFVATDRDDLFIEFGEDGTGRVFLYPGQIEVNIIYAVRGDLWTQMTDDSSLGSDRHVPVTYYWDYDGELLTFELWGEELNPSSRGTTMGHPYRLIPDAREALVATAEFPPGDRVFVTSRIVSGAGVGPDAITDIADIAGRVATVTIAKGQVITPDLLELPAE